MYDSLPKRERKFSIDVEGEFTGYKYAGEFTVKCSLSILEKQALELEKTRLLADFQNPTSGLLGIAHALSNLRTKIVKAPEWWTESLAGTKIEDENIFGALMDECSRAEKEWRDDVKKKAEEARKESGNQ